MEPSDESAWLEPAEARAELGYAKTSFYRTLDEWSEEKELKGLPVEVCEPLGGVKWPNSGWRFRAERIAELRAELDR